MLLHIKELAKVKRVHSDAVRTVVKVPWLQVKILPKTSTGFGPLWMLPRSRKSAPNICTGSGRSPNRNMHLTRFPVRPIIGNLVLLYRCFPCVVTQFCMIQHSTLPCSVKNLAIFRAKSHVRNSAIPGLDEDDGDYATLRELPLAATTATRFCAGDNISEGGKVKKRLV